MRMKLSVLIVCGALTGLMSGPASAAMAVIDVSAIRQLVQQVTTLRSQLATARDQLQQARTEYAALTGRRGMERLVGGVVRNYLPADWRALEDVLDARSRQFAALTRELEQLVASNSVLTADELDARGADVQARIAEARRAAALEQTLARDALSTTSQRFVSLQALIDAIASANDPKAVMDLQARVQSEQTMLANEHTKLEILFRTVEAERLARVQQNRERALRDVGSLRDLPALGL